MPLSRDDHKAVMRSTILAGRHARELIDANEWKSMTIEEGRVLAVLRKVRDIGRYASTVLYKMEKNDEASS